MKNSTQLRSFRSDVISFGNHHSSSTESWGGKLCDQHPLQLARVITLHGVKVLGAIGTTCVDNIVEFSITMEHTSWNPIQDLVPNIVVTNPRLGGMYQMHKKGTLFHCKEIDDMNSVLPWKPQFWVWLVNIAHINCSATIRVEHNVWSPGLITASLY